MRILSPICRCHLNFWSKALYQYKILQKQKLYYQKLLFIKILSQKKSYWIYSCDTQKDCFMYHIIWTLENHHLIKIWQKLVIQMSQVSECTCNFNFRVILVCFHGAKVWFFFINYRYIHSNVSFSIKYKPGNRSSSSSD